MPKRYKKQTRPERQPQGLLKRETHTYTHTRTHVDAQEVKSVSDAKAAADKAAEQQQAAAAAAAAARTAEENEKAVKVAEQKVAAEARMAEERVAAVSWGCLSIYDLGVRVRASKPPSEQEDYMELEVAGRA
jgi:hypothetical protein